MDYRRRRRHVCSAYVIDRKSVCDMYICLDKIYLLLINKISFVMCICCVLQIKFSYIFHTHTHTRVRNSYLHDKIDYVRSLSNILRANTFICTNVLFFLKI